MPFGQFGVGVAHGFDIEGVCAGDGDLDGAISDQAGNLLKITRPGMPRTGELSPSDNGARGWDQRTDSLSGKAEGESQFHILASVAVEKFRDRFGCSLKNA